MTMSIPKGIAAMALAGTIGIVLLGVLGAQAQPKLSWSQQKVELTTLSIPGTAAANVTLASSVALKGVALLAVPEIASHITISPASIATLAPNEPVTVNITLKVPEGAPVAALEGNRPWIGEMMRGRYLLLTCRSYWSSKSTGDTWPVIRTEVKEK